MYTRKLPDDLRQLLKKPLGHLILGSPSETAPRILEFIRKHRPRLIVTVGDECSKVGVQLEGSQWIAVFDRQVERRKVDASSLESGETLKVVNAAGTLSAEARQVLRTALRGSSNATIEVEGEEDLLTLAALLYAPDGAVVLYGQPGEGVVAVVVDDKIRNFARRIIGRMEVVR